MYGVSGNRNASSFSRRAHLFTTDTIGGDTAAVSGRRRALTQRARQIRSRSFAVQPTTQSKVDCRIDYLNAK